MKKYIMASILIAIALMFVIGCAPQAAPEKPIAKEPVRKAVEKTVASAPEPVVEDEPEEVEAAPKRVMDKKISDLFSKSDGRITSLRYMYQDQINYPEEWETWVTDNKMHVKLRELDNVKEDIYIDNIYLNLATKKAEGFCEMSVYRCADPNDPVDVKFAKYYRKTPLDWVDSVVYAQKESEEQMQQRTVWKLNFEDADGNSGQMWVDSYYGVPVKVTVNKNNYIFEDIAFNSVEDSDLEHGFITESY